MTKPKPKIYPAEFKESAVKLVIESNRGLVEEHPAIPNMA